MKCCKIYKTIIGGTDMGQRYSKIKYMLLGAIITVLASQSIVPTAASMVGKTINVYTGISVYVDDQEIIPTDVNGNRVDVFYYNGTTYLPARAISKVFGKPIQWEGKTQSIYIGSHKSDKPAVWLQELDYFTGNDLRVRDNVKDNMGNNRQETISGNGYTGEFDNTYLINGQYSAISGTLFQIYDERSTEGERASKLKIYGDGDLLYSAEVRGGVEPVDFQVDITGVMELRVEFDPYYATRVFGTSRYVAELDDVGLWT